MTDPKKPNDFDIAFDDLDDMLGEWEQTVDAGKARPESSPMPQSTTTSETGRSVAKPLYRPPSPSEAPRGPRGPEYHVGFDEDDDEDGATRIAQVPRELIDALLMKKREERPTVPPPTSAPAASPAPTPAAEPPRTPDHDIGGRVTMPTPELDDVDWDLDAMLSEPPPPRSGPSTAPPAPMAKSLELDTRRPPSVNEPRPRTHSRESILEMEEEEAFFAQVVKAPPAPAVPSVKAPSARPAPPPPITSRPTPAMASRPEGLRPMAPPPPSAFDFGDDDDSDLGALDEVELTPPVINKSALKGETTAPVIEAPGDEDDEPNLEVSRGSTDEDDDDGPSLSMEEEEPSVEATAADPWNELIADPRVQALEKAATIHAAEEEDDDEPAIETSSSASSQDDDDDEPEIEAEAIAEATPSEAPRRALPLRRRGRRVSARSEGALARHRGGAQGHGARGAARERGRARRTRG